MSDYPNTLPVIDFMNGLIEKKGADLAKAVMGLCYIGIAVKNKGNGDARIFAEVMSELTDTIATSINEDAIELSSYCNTFFLSLAESYDAMTEAEIPKFDEDFKHVFSKMKGTKNGNGH